MILPTARGQTSRARSSMGRESDFSFAGHSQYAGLVRRCLVIEVEDAIWRKQLTAITPDILRKLAALIGPNIVTDVEFRVAALRMRPRKDRPLPLFDAADEANRIADPIFRRLYAADRRRRHTAA